LSSEKPAFLVIRAKRLAELALPGFGLSGIITGRNKVVPVKNDMAAAR
jgi:hypothetical protein